MSVSPGSVAASLPADIDVGGEICPNRQIKLVTGEIDIRVDADVANHSDILL